MWINNLKISLATSIYQPLFYFFKFIKNRICATTNEEYSTIHKLVDWLDYNGYTLITKSIKTFTDDSGGIRRKGNMDIEIAVDMMGMTEYLNHMVLFSGDGDFRRLIEAVQYKCVRVTVVSTTQSRPPICSDELRRQADVFIDLRDFFQIKRD